MSDHSSQSGSDFVFEPTPAAPSETVPDSSSSVPSDWDEDLYQKTCAALQEEETQRSGLKAWTWFLVTLGLFALVFWNSFKVEELLLLIGVLFLHECGHFAGMRAFGYRNVQMFFIPFFGAAVSGRRHAAPVWQQAVVLLLGPLPGIFLGLLLSIVLQPTFESTAGRVVLMLVAVNAFNLLPLVPLDGGRLIDLLLFARMPWLAVAFRGFAVFGLAVIAWSLGSWVLGLLAGIMLLSLPFHYRKAKVERTLRRTPLELPEQLEALDDAQRRELVGWANRLIPTHRTPQGQAALVRQLHENLVSRHPGFLGRVGLLLVYGSGIVATLATVAVLGWIDNVQPDPQADELATAFVDTVDTILDLRAEMEEQANAMAQEPARADAVRKEVLRLRAEAEARWSELVKAWKAQPAPVQRRAFNRLRLALAQEFPAEDPEERVRRTEMERRLTELDPFQ
jgi:Zn-dependent protease